MAEKKTKAPAKPRARKKKSAAEAGSRGLSPAEMASGDAPADVRALTNAIEQCGGRTLATYREPLGGTWLCLAALPVERVDPTPFQRDLSEAHAERLTRVIDKVGRFLDPIVVVHEGDRFWTPNGHHRLAALRRLGAKSVTALAVPDHQIAYQILALNTEKAHALRERSLEVARMAQDLAKKTPGKKETDYQLEFEEAALITIGLCYEERPRFSGGAYHPLIKRSDEFQEKPMPAALELRKERAKTVLALDDVVTALVTQLRERGLQSPYLRNFVIARCNPLRFKRGATMPFDELLEKVASSAKKFDASKIKPQDLAQAGGAPEEAGT
jgi:ParB family chromosome partitioning protein